MFVVSKYRHETILKEKEEKHKQQLKHKEEQCRHFLISKDNRISELEMERDKLKSELELKSNNEKVIQELKSKLEEVNRKNEKLEKINKDLQSKVNVSIIAKQQLKALCVCKLDKKNFMYSFDLTPVNLSVSGRKVYDIAQLLG
ncbi:hypothetical protein [Paraclostridium sordellii]|uniref:hypothetical protein n=1 Tax=Paraclostridium sordellii TaxID=1505 RepID=UPI0005E70446|nr:hypothetical protein [Paeniclostridium sordellii]CEQ00313.1 Uncharacterised protein [[Clostridium] sordellii] [Paeniclostridium sordellii]